MKPARLFRNDQDLEVVKTGDTDASTASPQAGARAGQIESDAQLDGVVQREASAAATDEGGGLESGLADRIQSERSGGEPLPEEVRVKIEDKLGHDLSAVRVHSDANAADLNRQVGARAFTTGRDIFLGEGQSIHDENLLAHEATHTVQQGMSEEKPTTVGAADTAHEQAAEGSAAVVPASPDVVQRYTDNARIQGEYARVSDNGNVVVLGESNFSQQLYATDVMIASANKKLESAGDKGSYLRLTRTGDSLKHAGKTLDRVAPVFKPQGDANNAALGKANKGKDQDDTMSLWADCGRSSRVVMGSHGDQAPHGVYKDGSGERDTAPSYTPSSYSDEIYLRAMRAFLRDPAHAEFLRSGVHYGTSRSDILEPVSADEARAQYVALPKEGQKAFDAFAGVNTAANPEVGGGYTMNTEYGMPGFQEKGDMTWNFHWAGVVMKDGTDNITLENYADGKGYESINTDWNFQMYGTVKKGQTFHEQHLASNTHGSHASTFAVEPEGS